MSKISFISGSIFGLVNVLNNTFSIVYSQRHSISSLIDFGNNLFLMLTTICLNIILMMIITNIYFYIQKTYIFILSVLIIVGIPTQKKVMNLKKELNKYE